MIDTLALILSVIGCVNWGLIGIFQFDLVAWLFGGQDAIISRIIYTLVGLAGLWCASFLFRKSRFELTGTVFQCAFCVVADVVYHHVIVHIHGAHSLFLQV